MCLCEQLADLIRYGCIKTLIINGPVMFCSLVTSKILVCVVWFKMVYPSDVILKLHLSYTALSSGRRKWELISFLH